ncbi:MAG: hypothetical protein ACFFCS_13935, partial [Candidatus Hodarchaeota archaeon]
MDINYNDVFIEKLSFYLERNQEKMDSIKIPHITVKDIFNDDDLKGLPADGEPLVDFGILKDEGEWTLIKKYETIFDPILTREAILLTLPKRYQGRDIIKHACNWMAYKFTETRTTQRDFWDTWDRFSKATGSDLFDREPVMYLEFEKMSILEAKDVLRMLRKKDFNATDIISWFKSKASLYSRFPNPVMMELCFAASQIFMKNKLPPDREEIFDLALQNQYFTKGDLDRKILEENFFSFRSTYSSLYYINKSLLDSVLILVQFTTSRYFPLGTIRDMFCFPGMSIRLRIFSGNLIQSDSINHDITYGLEVDIPRDSVEHFINFMSNLKKLGLFSNLEISTIDKVITTKNFNQYVGNPDNPHFCWNSLRRDDDLILTTTV